MGPSFFEVYPWNSFSAVPVGVSSEEVHAWSTGQAPPPPTIDFRINSSSRRPGHLSHGGSVGWLLASPEMRSTLQGATGWDSIPLRILSEGGRKLVATDHHLLVVTGRVGQLDRSGGVDVEEELASRFRRQRGWTVDAKLWDGADVGRPDPERMLVVVESVAERILSARLRGVRADVIEDREFFVL